MILMMNTMTKMTGRIVVNFLSKMKIRISNKVRMTSTSGGKRGNTFSAPMQ